MESSLDDMFKPKIFELKRSKICFTEEPQIAGGGVILPQFAAYSAPPPDRPSPPGLHPLLPWLRPAPEPWRRPRGVGGGVHCELMAQLVWSRYHLSPVRWHVCDNSLPHSSPRVWLKILQARVTLQQFPHWVTRGHFFDVGVKSQH